MKQSTAILTFTCLLLLAMGQRDSPTGQPPAELDAFVRGNTAFGFDLARRLAAPDVNLFCSPYSVAAAVAVARSGARGSTEQQTVRALRFPSRAETQTALARIRKSIADASHGQRVTLATATGVWARMNYGFGQEFLRRAHDAFGAEVKLVDFDLHPDRTAGEVEAWVRRQTHGKIDHALPPNAVTADSRLLFVNTIYFKGQWASRFNPRETKDKAFRVSAAQTIPVPMMRQTHPARYVETDLLQAIELPYIGLDLSMIVLLPRQLDGLSELERCLSWTQLTNWFAAAQWRTVDLELPRFKLTSHFSLVQPLCAMGMTDAFDRSKADFTGMTPQRPLWIQFLQQCATVEVNEEGTVAAAATSGGMGCGPPRVPPPATFHADHPFLFLIRDNHTATILFLGHLTNPATA